MESGTESEIDEYVEEVEHVDNMRGSQNVVNEEGTKKKCSVDKFYEYS